MSKDSLGTEKHFKHIFRGRGRVESQKSLKISILEPIFDAYKKTCSNFCNLDVFKTSCVNCIIVVYSVQNFVKMLN